MTGDYMIDHKLNEDYGYHGQSRPESQRSNYIKEKPVSWDHNAKRLMNKIIWGKEGKLYDNT